MMHMEHHDDSVDMKKVAEAIAQGRREGFSDQAMATLAILEISKRHQVELDSLSNRLAELEDHVGRLGRNPY